MCTWLSCTHVGHAELGEAAGNARGGRQTPVQTRAEIQPFACLRLHSRLPWLSANLTSPQSR